MPRILVRMTDTRPSVHRLDNFMAIVMQKTFTDGPTSGSRSELQSVGATGVLAVFREYILRVLAVFRGSVPRILILPAPQVFRCWILRALRVLGVMYCSKSQYSPYLGRQYPITRSAKCTPYSEGESICATLDFQVYILPHNGVVGRTGDCE